MRIIIFAKVQKLCGRILQNSIYIHLHILSNNNEYFRENNKAMLLINFTKKRHTWRMAIWNGIKIANTLQECSHNNTRTVSCNYNFAAYTFKSLQTAFKVPQKWRYMIFRLHCTNSYMEQNTQCMPSMGLCFM